MGEPPGSRRLTDEQNTADEPGQTVTPPRGRRLQATADPRAADKRDDDPAADERTSPFPYAESFDEWVADETAAQDGTIGEQNSYGNDPADRPD